MRWSWWSRRMVISWLDRDPWVAVAFAVPLAILGLWGVATHPSLFLPLLVLAGVAFVVMGFYKGRKREPEQQAQVGAGPQKRNHQSRADQARAQAERKLSRLKLEAEARARAEAAQAEALAAEARARLIRLRAS